MSTTTTTTSTSGAVVDPAPTTSTTSSSKQHSSIPKAKDQKFHKQPPKSTTTRGDRDHSTVEPKGPKPQKESTQPKEPKDNLSTPKAAKAPSTPKEPRTPAKQEQQQQPHDGVVAERKMCTYHEHEALWGTNPMLPSNEFSKLTSSICDKCYKKRQSDKNKLKRQEKQEKQKQQQPQDVNDKPLPKTRKERAPKLPAPMHAFNPHPHVAHPHAHPHPMAHQHQHEQHHPHGQHQRDQHPRVHQPPMHQYHQEKIVIINELQPEQFPQAHPPHHRAPAHIHHAPAHAPQGPHAPHAPRHQAPAHPPQYRAASAPAHHAPAHAPAHVPAHAHHVPAHAPAPHHEDGDKVDKRRDNKKDKNDKKEKKEKEHKPQKEGQEKSATKNRSGKKEKGDKKQGGEAKLISGVKKERSKRVMFQAYVSEEDVRKGLQEKRYFYGQLRVNAKKYYDAYITVDGVDGDAYCEGLKYRNRAFNSDIVVFEMVRESEWKSKANNKDDDDEVEKATIKDTTDMGGRDQGTILLSSSLSKLQIKEKEALESMYSKNVDSDCEDEGSDVSEDTPTPIKIEIEGDDDDDMDEDFVIVPTTTTTSTTSGSNNNNVPKLSKKRTAGPTPVKNMIQDIKYFQSLVHKANDKNLYVSCRIVHILDCRHSRNHVGILTDQDNATFANFTPMDSALPRCLVFKETIPEFRSKPEMYKNMLISVSYGQWKETSYLPIGHFHSVFGECGEIEPETRALLKEYNVDTSAFSREVMDCLPQVPKGTSWNISQEEIAKRRDLRGQIIVSIDPDTAKDLDDALSCVPLPDGNFEVGVHIADVSHFVKPHTALDACAADRATTVYLVQKAIPMLPSLLCEELCSLNYGVERFAFSVIWTLTPEGKVINEWFGKSVIKSACRLTYRVAQAIIDGKFQTSWKDGLAPEQIKSLLGPDTPQHVQAVISSVMGLREIAKHLRQARMDSGAFNIHPTKLAFELDEKGNPVSTRIYQIFESNHLVEEFMLMANMQVASRIAKYFPENALLRRHPDPNPRKLQQFIDFCTSHDYPIDSSTVETFGASILALKEKVTDKNIFSAIQLLSIRSMRLAEYFCTGTEDEWRHYALNVDHYTHFTSPIRRYADIIVHRLLELSIEVERLGEQGDHSRVLDQLPETEAVAKISLQCNEKKLNARKAQERSDKVFLCILLQQKLNVTDAIVLSTGPTFISVIVPMFGSEQRIYLEDHKEDKLIISHSFEKETESNEIVWPGIEEGDEPIKQQYRQLTTVKVMITVDKSKFPIDTKCTLLHPLYVETQQSNN
ncbi:hypothetical protein SAMD00019534_087430 [Acytostelium subglobosum LB1]|uniref:hypothetical protein n=1 Tax=Acytostelium subglobosum LB1 TaxID=1410327 RepID=UPI0006450B3C|nr:hypothetical protein SAMD00019534_087430 [Acytostelium subglobosum LB1]GAM25568.1 hypothetical protein SAMD00019534_087430 [Acytostelium subglobosum LB1]|eukprot:XP_012751554.1 hypothetical protein SAMD00019534_087430 [Acytostelium subglobosum LB1]